MSLAASALRKAIWHFLCAVRKSNKNTAKIMQKNSRSNAAKISNEDKVHDSVASRSMSSNVSSIGIIVRRDLDPGEGSPCRPYRPDPRNTNVNVRPDAGDGASISENLEALTSLIMYQTKLLYQLTNMKDMHSV